MKSVHYRKIQNQPSTSESAHYAVMIDAGSSGSRVHLYTWPPYSEENRGLIKARMLKDYKGQDLQKQITPGLSSFANHPEDAFDYIYPLIEFANRNIPQNKHKETPLYILATAGMRLLSSASQEIILNNLRESVKSNSSFLFSSSNVEVITGKEEGIYSWISVNYLLNRYDHSLSSEHTVAINFGNGNTTRPQTVGMLEMGGASVQIAFEITSKYQLDDVKSRRQKMSGGSSEDVLAQVDLGNPHDSDHNYLVYVTTFLGLGVNVAKEAYLKYLIERERNNHSSSNRRPEVPAAADSSTAILSSTIPEIHSLTLSDPCMCRNCPLNVSIVSVDGQQYSLTLKGLGDFEQCENILQRLISPMQERNVLCELNMTCPIAELYNTQISFHGTEFYGFSELWYSMEDVLGVGGQYNYDSFKKVASEYCSTDFELLKKGLEKNSYPNADERRLIEECFKAAWITTLLHVGFKMPKDFKKYKSALFIGGNQVEWTLGALLYRVHPPSPYVLTNGMQIKSAVTPDFSSFHSALFLLCTLFVLTLTVIFLKHLSQMIHKDQKIK
ncbi:ectonucleoside triphosphate diphosphohydrolase 7-like isoform X3 [Brevipalpus obovatus]